MTASQNKFRKTIRRFVSPAFIVMLLFSLMLWFLTKLSYNYTAQVPIAVNIDGNKFRVSCIAEGTGYRIMSHRIFRKSEIRIPFSDIQATPSVVNAGKFVVSAYSLQNVISARVNDLKIISVGEIPEIKIPYS